MKKFSSVFWGGRLRTLLGWVAAIGLSGGLLLFRLKSLAPSAAVFEQPKALGVTTYTDLIKNPLNLPHKLLQYGLVKLGHSEVWAMRSVSCFFGLIAIGLFYYVLRHWYTNRIAILGTLLFASSSWFLHTARSASPAILQLFLLAFVAYGVWLINTKRYGLSYLVGFWLLAASLYVPGLIWFVIGVSVWQRRRLLRMERHVASYWRLPIYTLALAMLAPLVWAFAKQPLLLKTWVGLPQYWPGILKVAIHIIEVPLAIFVRMPADPVRWVGTSPLLDIFSSAMVILGLYAYRHQLRLDRAKQLALVFLAGSLLIGLGGAVDKTIILPFLYFLATGGIALMLQQWLTVFPRNPAAGSIGYGLLVVAAVAAMLFQLDRYFIAWPKAPQTKQAYSSLTVVQ